MAAAASIISWSDLEETTPEGSVQADGEHGARLVHARIVVELRGLEELHDLVVPRTYPLGRVDCAGDEVFVDLTARKRNRRSAQLGHDVAAEARDTHLQALEVVGRVDFLVEPAAHLDTGVTAHEALEVELGSEFVPELLAAAEADPGVHLGVGQPERHGGEVRPARVLAFPVILCGVVALGIARGDFVEGVERADALTGGEVLDLDAALGHFVEARCEALGARAEAREVTRPGGDHRELDAVLRDRRFREGGCRSSGTCDAGKTGGFHKFTSFHGLLPEVHVDFCPGAFIASNDTKDLGSARLDSPAEVAETI